MYILTIGRFFATRDFKARINFVARSRPTIKAYHRSLTVNQVGYIRKLSIGREMVEKTSLNVRDPYGILWLRSKDGMSLSMMKLSGSVLVLKM